MTRPPWREALRRSGVLAALSGFSPRVAGTPPLGLDLPGSDLDILCHAPEALPFAQRLWTAFGGHTGFVMHQWRAAGRSGEGRAVVARFQAEGWAFELFGAACPVRRQAGWRHFRCEARLLRLGGPCLRAAVMQKRRQGAKTEPAFASVLGLRGDPYAALLQLAEATDERLRAVLMEGGFAGGE